MTTDVPAAGRMLRVCSLDEVPPGGALGIEVAGEPVVVVRVGGSGGEQVYALQDECSHAEVPLSEGDVEIGGGVCAIECWLHGSRFDLRTGRSLGPPATEPVPAYPAIVSDGDIYIDMGGHGPAGDMSGYGSAGDMGGHRPAGEEN